MSDNRRDGCDDRYIALVNLNLRTKVTSLVALSLLVPAAVAATGSLASGSAAAAEPTYDATIRITEHGIPHIEADSFPNLAYGAGWATAAASTCTLMDTLLTARGLRSEYLGPDETLNDRVGGNGTNLQWDTLVTDLHDRGVVENLLADPVAGPSDTRQGDGRRRGRRHQRVAEHARDHRPGLRRPDVDPAGHHHDRRLVRDLPRPADRLDDPAADRDHRPRRRRPPARGPRRSTSRSRPRGAAHEPRQRRR